MSEEEQLTRAYEQSLYDTGPTAPPHPNDSSHSSTNLDSQTLRQLRLRRFQT